MGARTVPSLVKLGKVVFTVFTLVHGCNLSMNENKLFFSQHAMPEQVPAVCVRSPAVRGCHPQVILYVQKEFAVLFTGLV